MGASKTRPATAYGGIGMKELPRNIKSIVKDSFVKSSQEKNEQLENILTDMNVINRTNIPISSLNETNTEQISEKFGPAFVNINK